MNISDVTHVNLTVVQQNVTVPVNMLGILIPPEYLNNQQVGAMISEINGKIDDVWILIVAVHVLCMQLGFIMLEVGTIRTKNSRNIIYKNMVDAFVCAVTFYFVGYRNYVGGAGGLLGSGSFFDAGYTDSDYRSWVIGYCFCSTTCTAVSGALAERTFLDTYIFFTFIMSSLVYPVLACWVWGGGWLQQMGFKDHGGSGVVHMTAGFAGMIGAYILGPRLGYFKNRTPDRGTFEYARLQH